MRSYFGNVIWKSRNAWQINELGREGSQYKVDLLSWVIWSWRAFWGALWNVCSNHLCRVRKEEAFVYGSSSWLAQAPQLVICTCFSTRKLTAGVLYSIIEAPNRKQESKVLLGELCEAREVCLTLVATITEEVRVR